jgi:hypothetical protein
MPIIVGPTFWQFANRFSLGEPAPDGGNVICKSGGGTIWVVAPASSEVSRNWDSRNDAVTTATNCTSATGWFVPTCSQLKNPGYECRTYWDSYSSSFYRSSTEGSSTVGWLVSVSNGTTNTGNKTKAYCVRAFRCVTY